MAYSELIKNFEKIRDYIREFYVYGFRSREEYASLGSTRSYDDERRRVESWLEDYIAFRQTSQGKNVFISVDSRTIEHNPFYRAFKTKSFTDKDILLHFTLLDYLMVNGSSTIAEIQDGLYESYPQIFAGTWPDESTIRKKLRELQDMGIISARKEKRRMIYEPVHEHIDLKEWIHALDYFSEQAPLGVVGFFLLDKLPAHESLFRFKHHYLMGAIDSEILCQLLVAIDEHKKIQLTVKNLLPDVEGDFLTYINTPVSIYMSTENGRQYCMGWNEAVGRFYFSRLDRIVKVELLKEDPDFEKLSDQARKERDRLWGVSFGGLEAPSEPEHLEMVILVGKGEGYILQRLEREKRCGRVENLSPGRYLFTADVYDAQEMLPWIYSLTGRIESIRCSNPAVTDRLYRELEKTVSYYE